MTRIDQLSRPRRELLNERVLKLYDTFCRKEFGILLYDYQLDVARELLSTFFVYPHDVAVKEARQSGKTENITLLIRLLIVFLRHFLVTPLMAGIASPRGEQAKT